MSGQCPICEQPIVLDFWHFYASTGDEVMVWRCTYCTWLYVVFDHYGKIQVTIVE